MTNDTDKVKSVQDRISEIVQESLGDLITKEDIKPLVDRAIDQMFFQEREEGSGYRKRPLPPMHELIFKERIDPMVREAAAEWMNEHPQEMLHLIQKAIGEGIAGSVAKAVNNIFSGEMFTLSTSLEQRFRDILDR